MAGQKRLETSMSAIAFTTTYKNYYLDLITGRQTSISTALNATAYPAGLRISTGGGTQLIGATGTSMAGAWTTPVAGTASLSLSVTPTSTNTAANMSFYSGYTASDIATGTVSTTGGGGNIIVPSTSFVNATPQTVTSVLKVPTLSGGSLNINQALANAIANTILNATNIPAMAASGGAIKFYDGTQPTTADTALGSQTQLGSYSFAAGTDFASAAGGSVALAVAKTITVTATGTAQFFRWTKGPYTIDGSVNTTGADCIVDTTAFVNANNRSMTGLTLVFP